MSKYRAKSTVLSRDGWTDAAIKKFLGSPDVECKNPNYKSAPPMKLFLLERIESVESSLEFLAFVEKSKIRREGAIKGVKTKMNRLCEYVENLVIDVPVIPYDELIQKSCKHFNNRQDIKEAKYEEWLTYRKYDDYDPYEEAPDFSYCSPDSSEEHLKRITINYLRHCMTDYEAELKRMGGKPGKDDAYIILKEKINNAIIEKYEWLKAE